MSEPPNPMRVTRVRTEFGSRVEPPLQQSWTDFTKLRWLAAVVEGDTGLRVQVRMHLARWPRQPTYSMAIGRVTLPGGRFESAWLQLACAQAGAQAKGIDDREEARNR